VDQDDRAVRRLGEQPRHVGAERLAVAQHLVRPQPAPDGVQPNRAAGRGDLLDGHAGREVVEQPGLRAPLDFRLSAEQRAGDGRLAAATRPVHQPISHGRSSSGAVMSHSRRCFSSGGASNMPLTCRPRVVIGVYDSTTT
jgi:hypothetical protein